ncbi:MAG: exodeoxyribonuclease VII small subunit [Alphaproteobacteria bacterium]|jgi:exodeoxyribonuclease VII small subunit|nr:exodeoxyribonuclease VII small subunit [Alphaproteobacteria bacterium]MBL6776696.1 exodeoxyribonuclease VII small subunit [Alphaproteobacteria bacterium]
MEHSPVTQEEQNAETRNAETSNKGENLDTLSFEEALSQLEAIVDQLERGDVSLDKAIDAYSRGMALKGHCQARLEEARLKVEQINLPEEGGSVSTKPFDTR